MKFRTPLNRPDSEEKIQKNCKKAPGCNTKQTKNSYIASRRHVNVTLTAATKTQNPSQDSLIGACIGQFEALLQPTRLLNPGRITVRPSFAFQSSVCIPNNSVPRKGTERIYAIYPKH